ncbi:hypothetical protein TPHA_0G00450 [Tetrapisispora phaffii CBS 4417]|uniref:mRNA 3'-end-processing protein RNA14 n=1 Tax=Tetrapisispora phaffii (strain ATCC 24235 / CBS 4417 / NBRC 1672 / NRRL Y-8282 / UCD 70-5) TaxID=1071381 RepID=G8BVF3_TETPH|nr:hypothetical protein TPHA_0G00450 [Tetrapisispora phaffii CBS 4417]CCE63881.1 hypothetical protein TPHA_0G00450 [Tetrapisispora phaffii CBS 4417]
MSSKKGQVKGDFPLSREDATQQPSKSSLVSGAEEVSFPRGGASALTSLELKQVSNEAANDVLFGNNGKKKRESPSTGSKSKKSNKKSKKADATELELVDDEDDEFAIIQHVNFKNLKVGSQLLGQISSITRNDLRISFTDGINGYVPITNISEQITDILTQIDEEMADSSDDSDSDEEYESSDDKSEKKKLTEKPNLIDLFKVGQWLRCSVTENTALDATTKKKRRLELSIEPSAVNTFSADDLNKFSTVQCSVKSIEDHGAILDLGISNFTGFISKKDSKTFDNLKPGHVFLANIINKSDRTVTVNQVFSKKNKVSHISSIDCVVPGQLVEFLSEKIGGNGIFGKAFGSIAGYITDIHLETFSEEKLKEKFPVGQNVPARIIAILPNKEGDNVLLLSAQTHIISLTSVLSEIENLEAFPIGYTFDSATIKGRDSSFLYLTLDNERVGQVHNKNIGSALESEKISARVLGYTSVDNAFQLSTDPEMLAKKYVRAIDIKIGEVLTNCEITAVSTEGIQLKLFGGQFTAFVPPLHISDTKLVYPERKFKIASKVKGRVLNVNDRGHIFVTLKKTLVNTTDDDDFTIITSYDDATAVKESNSKTIATVLQFRPAGAVISFFGGVRGFIPNSEISEAFVRRPEEHLRLGQTVIVKLLEVSGERSRIVGTCKVSAAKSAEQKDLIKSFVLGRTIIDVEVIEKTKESVLVELKDSELRGVINVGHLSDSRIEQNRAELKKIRIGSKLRGLIIDIDSKTQIFNMSLKKSLIKDAEKEILPINYQQIVSVGKSTPLHGYVKSVSNKGVFVAFNGKFVGLVLPNFAVESRKIDINSIYYVNQSVTAYLLRFDDGKERFLLSLRDEKPKQKENTITPASLLNPVDSSVSNFADCTLGKFIKAKITAVKKNQLNVNIADNLFGRIHIAEVYDNLKQIKDAKHPLSNFKVGDIVNVKVIGLHDFVNHKFVSKFSELKAKSILELTMKPSEMKSNEVKLLKASDLEVGQDIVGFVNNVKDSTIWLSITPSLHARLSSFNLTENSNDSNGESLIGSALKVQIKSIDSKNNSLIVKTESDSVVDINVGSTVDAKIVKVTDKLVLLQLRNGSNAVSYITDALDDYSKTLPEVYGNMISKIIPATVLAFNAENNKIKLSLRSKGAYSLPTVHTDLKPNDIVNAIVKNVTEKGIFVALSSNLDAFVPISKLSDSYLKEWKAFFKPMQPVVGKVVTCANNSRILLTLKESEVNGEIQILKNYNDIKVGDIFSGVVKNVADFGVFVKLDNTLNVSGLAHSSEVAESVPEDLQSLFGPGDKVKAYVLKVNPEKKQLSLSLKASHFSKTNSGKSANDSSDEDGDVIMEDAEYNNVSDAGSDVEDTTTVITKQAVMSTDGLSLSAGFDWTAKILDQAQSDDESEEDEDFTETKKNRHRKKRAHVVEDKTIDINTRAPESVGDFERLIMGNPNSSVVWMNYMAFQLQLSEIDKAREISERALKTINFREEAEKLNIWIAKLNLENTFGSEETLEDVFKKACQYMDSFTIHSKLLSILQMSGQTNKTAELFKTTAKKFGSEKVSIWVSWGDWLISQKQSNEARNILSSALKALPKRHHIEVVRKFAQLEYAKGDPERGRSLFEGLIADAGKRIDIWNVYIDQEIKVDDKKKVEDLFERVIQKKITRKQAKFFFNKWLQYEEGKEDEKAIGYVKAKATEFAESHPKAAAEEQ